MALPVGIQGQLLEITVVGCNKLRDTEWISRQDPYICLEYATTKFRTRTCTDGGKNPTFNEKFSLNLIEGLREVSVAVWNSNTLSSDDFIGSGKILLNKVLSQGFDDTTWSIMGRRGKYAGEIRLIMHYANARHSAAAHHQTAPNYSVAAPPPPYAMTAPYPNHHHAPPTSYPQAGYPASYSYPSYPPMPVSYAQQTYPPPPAATYPPAPYPQQPYSQPASPYHPPAPYPGIYPPPPY